MLFKDILREINKFLLNKIIKISHKKVIKKVF